MHRTIVISDIHGEIGKFEKLLEKTEYRPDADQLILLGDYVDRGPDSKRTVEKVMELKKKGAIVLKGNHDDMMEKSFREGKFLKVWLLNGGLQTLESYGYELPRTDDGMESMLADLNPLKETDTIRAHIDFFESLDHLYETDDYIFVHAGVHPVDPLESTDPAVFLWIRDEFHEGYAGEKTVIFGHTPTHSLHEGCDVHFGTNNIIGIDGGCVFGGRLNALELPSRKVYHVE
ncbi:MAG TPA: metallophosphoesterase family protein [Bacillales bacterium]|nr:metallophosphoesterase family protein [Bacillales bacterium]